MLALEKETSKNYTELVDEMFAQPLGLVNTYPSPGDDRKGVVPPGDSSWGADFGFNAPYVPLPQIRLVLTIQWRRPGLLHCRSDHLHPRNPDAVPAHLSWHVAEAEFLLRRDALRSRHAMGDHTT